MLFKFQLTTEFLEYVGAMIFSRNMLIFRYYTNSTATGTLKT